MHFRKQEIWLITGSQHLYGEKTLDQVAVHAKKMAKALTREKSILVSVVFKSVMTDRSQILKVLEQANSKETCIGIIAWMHTFSPARMWIAGLKILSKPMLHLHTQFNRDIGWSSIDMDFMNLNQSAHGGREFGHINTRLQIRRKVVAGHWQDPEVIDDIAVWCRAALGWSDLQSLKIARLGDNMREVSVTEGDKVAAEMTFGFAVNGYGLGDLQPYLEAVTEKDIAILLDEYGEAYDLMPSLRKGGDAHQSLRDAAQIELGLRDFLGAGAFGAFTDTFENLNGLVQLPGIAVQRLMADGYGFGAEGDWKAAALVRTLKVMAAGLPGGNSFMEDYTYHLTPGDQLVLGAHMLEICPTITTAKPSCEVHPLSIGGKDDPVRLVFSADPGPALNVSLIDLGHRFRMLVNLVDTVEPLGQLPNLPVARACWKPQPDLKTSATAWILAGGSHHTCFSQNITKNYLEDFCDIAGIELLIIDQQTDLYKFKQALRWNEIYYRSI